MLMAHEEAKIYEPACLLQEQKDILPGGAQR